MATATKEPKATKPTYGTGAGQERYDRFMIFCKTTTKKNRTTGKTDVIVENVEIRKKLRSGILTEPEIMDQQNLQQDFLNPPHEFQWLFPEGAVRSGQSYQAAKVDFEDGDIDRMKLEIYLNKPLNS